MRAVAEDAARLLTLIAAFHGESGRVVDEPKAESARVLLANGKLGRAWLCAIGERDCGYGLACFRHSVAHGGTIAILDDLYVVPEFRARGIGGAMLQGIEADLMGAAVKAIMLDFDPEDPSAASFYARAGYTVSPLRTARKTLAPAPARR